MEFIRKSDFYRWLTKPNKSTFRQYVEAFIVILPIAFVIRTFGYGLYVVPSGSMETTMLVGERFVADKFTVLFSDVKRGDIISFNDATFPYSENKYKRFFEQYFWGPSNVTKRVIGIPGDHVQGVVEDGHPVIYRNGEKLDEPYLNKYPIVAVAKIDPALFRTMSASEFDKASKADKIFSFKSYDPKISFYDQPFYRIKQNRVLADQVSPETVWALQPGTEIGDGKDTFDIKLGPDEYWVMGDNRLGSCDSRSWGTLKKELIHGKIVFRIMSIDSDDNWIIFDFLKNPIDFFRRIRWSRWFQIIR